VIAYCYRSLLFAATDQQQHYTCLKPPLAKAGNHSIAVSRFD
ncbi:MAG: hypothetical protein ACI9WS_000626, partial [Paraglaciecola psychrophila]